MLKISSAGLMTLVLLGCSGDGALDLLPRGDGGSDASSNDGAADGAREVSGDCPGGLTLCGGACVDLANDPLNCNRCGNGCLHYQFCHAAACTCLPGFTLCNGACTDFASDPAHCGGCANAPCGVGQRCENSVCVAGVACTSPLTGCALNGGTACVSLAAGFPFCGDCATACGPGETCAFGACRPYAPATPCVACPCAAECARALRGTSSCCPGVPGGAQPICVEGIHCP